MSVIVVPLALTRTYKDEKFYWDDTGSEDPNRLMLFTTEQNLQVLKENRAWYGDGTFDISSIFFKQIYTIYFVQI